MVEILLIDNYDSFTFNLYHYLQQSGAQVQVLPNDSAQLKSAAQAAQGLVLSPGPSSPQNSGKAMEIFLKFFNQKPVLGVCLGMQIINEALGGKTVPASQPVHGKACMVTQLRPTPIFRQLPERFKAARYHSLICSQIPPVLQVTARAGNVPMAFQHQRLPVFGVQFHPESFLTPRGLQIIKNFVQVVHENLA